MATYDWEVLRRNDNSSDDNEFSTPIDISDIINICREYTKLGWQIQGQMESILEIGVEESINSGFVNKQSLPHIKQFLNSICSNVYFGDAVSQANTCMKLIEKYEGVKLDLYLN